MTKRRVFDIDFDLTEGAESPAPAEARRGPMATAISENADALAERKQAEAAIRDENDRLAHEYVALKKAGRILGNVPIDAVRTAKLSRDRSPTRDPDLDELKASIREVGLSNPIHVEDMGEGVYELIQGYRRLAAFRELHEETGEDAFATIPAVLTARGAQLEELYRRMVDENLVRRDISFAEMAQLAMDYAKEQHRTIGEPNDAIDRLYASAGRQKRAYIRNFARLLQEIGQHLKFPEAIPRSLGLSLLKVLDSSPPTRAQLRAVLHAAPDRDAAEELEILRRAILSPRGQPKKAKGPAKTAAKTTLRIAQPEGFAKCAVSRGRLEVQLERDFSQIDVRKLEYALREMLEKLRAD